MRILLGQLTPHRGEPARNLDRIEALLEGTGVELAVFPELFLSGYRTGDRMHRLAVRPGDELARRLAELARRHATHLAVGAPLALDERPGEVANAVLWVTPSGALFSQAKRYLPSFGPFEEGHFFSASNASVRVPLGEHWAGLAICYDAFFPEVFRSLALDGAELFVVISASPVTSGKLFEKVLPARAVENACPLLFVNRVGVEDGIVFGGGSGGFDVRGELLAFSARPAPNGEPEERLLEGELDLAQARRWRPFRPVLRDRASRPGGPSS
jgi:predicted amidohydrolase